MHWISALQVENVLAEQAERRRRVSAAWGPPRARRPRRPGAGPSPDPRPRSVVRLPPAWAESDAPSRAEDDAA